MDVLKLSHVSKAFGSRQIIKDISFSVKEHSIYGFIGQNGAGKTTTMKMILGLLETDEGEIFVCDKKVQFGQNQTNQFVGYLPDVPEFYDFMTPKEYLMLCGSITGMEKKQAAERAEELLEMVGLSHEKKRMKGFSRGMKQRLGIAQALFHKPKLLICDEPTSALDPVGRKEILDLLVKAKEETTIIFSTHILSDVERICDEIAFLHKGEIVLQGDLEQVRSRNVSGDLEIDLNNAEECKRLHAQFFEGKQVGNTRLVFENLSDEKLVEILRFLAEEKICPQKIERLEPDLEAVFMEVVGK